MDRRDWLLKNITREQRGIEIGPYHNPLVPKKLGYNSVSIDVYERDQLRTRANADASIAKEAIDEIEEVDLVGSCTNIEELVAAKYSLGSFDYIISSHNLEHMPDPLRFLQACQKVLRPGGIISLAVPDHRACFDYFRPHSTLADWLEAYFAKRQRPTAVQIFRQFSLHSFYWDNGRELGGFTLEHDPANVRPLQVLEEHFETYKQNEAQPNDTYHDVHCWSFTPSALELILRELYYLDLIRFETQELTATHGCEFFVRLGNSDSRCSLPRKVFYEQRHALLHRINNELAANSILTYKANHQTTSELSGRLLASLQGTARSVWQAGKAAAWNFISNRR